MPFRDAFVILETADLGRLSAFYVDRLGFEPGYRWPDHGEPAFVVVSLGPFSIGLSRSDSPAPPGRSALWLYTDDVDAETTALRRSGVEVVQEPADTEFGERMSTVADPDGNVVHLGQAG